MVQTSKDVEFIVPDAVYRKIVMLALQDMDGIIPLKEKDVSVRKTAEGLKATVHITGFLGDNLEALACKVQKETAAALAQMIAPPVLAVQVFIDDIAVKGQ